MLTFIHLDTIKTTWGDGTALAYNDATRRPNISFNWAVDGSGNLQNANSAGANISYVGDGFPTARPVRVVLDKGDTSYLDLATLNSAYTAHSIGTKATVTGGELVIGTNKITCAFGWLNQTPRKADGSYATTDGLPYDGSNADNTNAIYYELVLLSKPLEKAFDFLGVGADIISNNLTAYFNLGGFLFLDEITGAITSSTVGGASCIGISIGVRPDSDGAWNGKDYKINNLSDVELTNNFLGNPELLEPFNETEVGAGKTYSLEFNLSQGVGLVNRTDGNIYSANDSTYLSSIGSKRILPIISYWNRDGAFSIDNLGLIGFDDIIS